MEEIILGDVCEKQNKRTELSVIPVNRINHRLRRLMLEQKKRRIRRFNNLSKATVICSSSGMIVSALSLEQSFLGLIPFAIFFAYTLLWEYANGYFGSFQRRP